MSFISMDSGSLFVHSIEFLSALSGVLPSLRLPTYTVTREFFPLCSFSNRRFFYDLLLPIQAGQGLLRHPTAAIYSSEHP